MPVSGQYNGFPIHHPVRGKSFDDSEAFLSTNKPTARSRGLPENNLAKSFSVDKERANSVAKIKVVVRLIGTNCVLRTSCSIAFFLSFFVFYPCVVEMC